MAAAGMLHGFALFLAVVCAVITLRYWVDEDCPKTESFDCLLISRHVSNGTPPDKAA